MNVWLSSCFLVAGLFLSSSAALTAEECQPLVKPLPLIEPSTMYGRWITIAGYVDGEGFNAILKATESAWVNVTQSPSSPNAIVTHEKDKINGTCVDFGVNVTIEGNTGFGSLMDMIHSKFHFLPSCEGCSVMSVNTTARNLDKIFQQLNFNMDVTGEEIHVRALYLIGKESTLKDSDLEHFKQQASCLGFSREPDFLYDPKHGLCA
ncbi:uncharacterized protein LOC117959285 isoform X2 [Etheostoma cragini]|uniref:uncharacterized protein LOC117959285 isoform X2 n=1 Tax=Etheostoma cragini TaxID=417921 RepID=UPI00155E3EDF|nr:uncharacterized protein LOC117959285 isoform X2 [Etheostoma cragini]